MGKSKEFRRQLKHKKVLEGFESAGYSITQWYVDPVKNSCLFILVRNNINNIEFICLIPQNFYLPYNDGIFLYEDDYNTPDVEDSISMWNECDLEKLFIQIHNKVIIRTSKNDYVVYTCKEEKPNDDEIDTLARYANEMSVLNDELDKISEDDAKYITQKNPFDVLLDGGSFEKVQSSRIEDVQPCVLVDYNGYTLGQAMPVMDFIEFFNQNEIKENINIIAKRTKTIHDFQTEHIKKSFEEAFSFLTSFKESIQASYNAYIENLKDSQKDFNTIQTILEKNNSSTKINDIASRANKTLRILLDEQIEKRDNMISLLHTIKNVFGEI